MSRVVFCQKYQIEMEGLDKPPFPGEAGELIFQTISKQAWQEWLKHQTLLINEKRLQLFDPETQTYLAKQRELFFSGETVDKAEGYIPTNTTDNNG